MPRPAGSTWQWSPVGPASLRPARQAYETPRRAGSDPCRAGPLDAARSLGPPLEAGTLVGMVVAVRATGWSDGQQGAGKRPQHAGGKD